MPFEIVRNDITQMRVDAIVNAANQSLLGGGGVDGAIHRAAGPRLLAECRTLGGCGTGEARITKGYDLPARYVIHTVGPVWHGGARGEAAQLAACYRHSLELAKKYRCETVAFPLISAGAYGYPRDQAMAVATEAITSFLQDNDMTVYLVLFGRADLDVGRKLFRDVQAYIDDVYAETHSRDAAESRRRELWREDENAAARFDEALGRTLHGGLPDDEAFEALEAPRSVDAAPEPEARPRVERRATHADRPARAAQAAPDWDALLRRTDEGFSEALMRLIDEKGMTDAQCYKKANVDRKLFSKIRSNPAYRPSKPTVFAFAVALELSLSEADNLLRKAGFALSHSSKFDIILEYFLKTRNYDIYQINEVLFHYDMPLLGSGAN